MSLKRILHIVRKEFLQLRRDRRLLTIVFISPVFQLIMFGYAVTTDVKEVKMAVYDLDKSFESRQLLEKMTGSELFKIAYSAQDSGDVDALLRQGKALMTVEFPPDFARRLAGAKTAPVQIILDGSDSNTASIAMGYALRIISNYNQELLRQQASRLGASAPSIPSIEPRLRVWFNPELKSVNYMIPAVLGLILSIVMTVLTSAAIVKEREIGTLEQLLVTPIRPMELMLGKATPFLMIGFIDVIIVLLVGRYWFKVPFAGSLGLLFLLSLGFLMASLGIGLLVSTLSRTQQQAMMTVLFINMPSVLLSGFMFPIENMPHAIQLITYVIPLRYFAFIVRGIMLNGAGLSLLWQNGLALVMLGLAIFTLSALRFQRRLA